MGLVQLTTPAEVEAQLGQPGTSLVFINSVCGCAAGGARPAIATALSQGGKLPTRCLTVFAGVDGAATQQARSHFAEFPVSSPSAALLKDGEVVWMLHRHQIEGRQPRQITELFTQAFAQHC